ncbi:MULTISPECIES: hypothetical protein [Streptomyces]|uniref:hypothetical protein n=1 Tax=Streptomyces TaxID=1883 RepID=UPI001F1DCFC1|nr:MULTISPECIES: hypothetical protein [Streptomyces]
MPPTRVKEHHASAPPPTARTVPPSGSSVRMGPGGDQVREVLDRTGARASAEERIGRLVAQGLRHLDDGLLPGEGAGGRLRRLLASAADGSASGDGHPAPGPDAAPSGSPVSSCARETGR